MTATRSGGRWWTALNTYCCTPPTRGGKSLVTTRVRGTSMPAVCWQNMAEQEIRALDQGSGFVGLPAWRLVLVTGSDAVGWLNDLVTNRVDDLGVGEARRSLLLSRTGHVRADVHVGRVPQ